MAFNNLCKKIRISFFSLLGTTSFFFFNPIFCSYQKITLLTAPIGHNSSQYGGPLSVTQSLLNGLAHIGARFNYNPSQIEEVGDVVMVLANTHALGQVIELKRQGKVKKILAGPNLLVRANEDGGILASPEIDVCIVPSYWVKPSYEDDEPSLKNRIQIWYAGVDINYWNPTVTFQQKVKNGVKDVLVYWKTESESFCQQVEAILKKQGFNPKRLRYGSYDKERLKKKLSKSLFAVFITRSESQGIAFAESWAMDVPTIVWDPQEPLVIRGKSHWPVAACPYLQPSNGLLWRNQNELTGLIQNIGNFVPLFSPRSWVMQNMSDEVSARLLLTIINNEPNAVNILPF